MNNPKGLIITILIVALPIVWLCFRLNAIDKAFNESGEQITNTENLINEVINEEINNATENNPQELSNYDSGESKSSNYGNPISKLVDGAKINVASATIYAEPDDSSSVVASVYKDTVVTVQDYENGWSNVKLEGIGGWIRTEYVTKPEDESTSSSLTSAVGHSATVLVDTLNVRNSADASAVLLDQLNKGDTVNIIGANDNETWFEIQYGTRSGWISGKSDYVKVNY